MARTIHSLDGTLLLSEGIRITEINLEKLTRYGIKSIYIDDELSSGIQPADTVSHDILTTIKVQVKNVMSLPSIKSGIDGKNITELVDRLLEQILASGDVLHQLSDIRSIDDYTFSHSVNVSIYAMITGISLGMKQDAVRELGVGALLHDIGKLMIDESILQKPSGLTTEEFEEVKTHTTHGSNLIHFIKGINAIAADVALSHHERMDGSGYPRGLRGGAISTASRIVAIADVYDAFTSDRVYRARQEPCVALDYISGMAEKHFDSYLTEVFLRHMAYYPLGTAVVLTSGEKGLVSGHKSRFAHLPVVKLVVDSQGMLLDKYLELDLGIEKEKRISTLWEI